MELFIRYDAWGAAVLCAVSSGVAVILQKLSLGKTKQKYVRISSLWRLIGNPLFLLSIFFYLLAGAGLLAAVRDLALFVVQSIVAASVVVTALAERFSLGYRLAPKAYAAIAVVLIGLSLVAGAASADTAAHVGRTIQWAVVAGPLAVLVLGVWLMPLRAPAARIALAALGGASFGATAIAARLLTPHGAWWTAYYQPMALALAAYAFLGFLLVLLALRRSSATIVNAVSVVAQTILPAVAGVVMLGDHVRVGFWPAAVIGFVCALGGVLWLLVVQKIPA